jgi:cell division transport system permease protein
VSAWSDRSYAWRRTLALASARPGGFLLGIVLCSFALAIPLLLAALLHSAWPWSARLQAGPEIALFVAPGTAPRELDELKGRLAALDGVTSVRLIPRDQAYAELSKRAGLAATPAMRSNPLPDVLVARFAVATAPDVIERGATATRAWTGVDAVQSGADWHRRLTAMGRAAGRILLVIGALATALIALVLVIAAQGQVQHHSRETALLRRVGARTAFIVRPYAYYGALTLGLGAALSIAAVVGAQWLIGPPIAALAALYDQAWAWPQPPAWVPAALVGASAALGWTAGWLGARFALRQVDVM